MSYAWTQFGNIPGVVFSLLEATVIFISSFLLFHFCLNNYFSHPWKAPQQCFQTASNMSFSSPAEVGDQRCHYTAKSFWAKDSVWIQFVSLKNWALRWLCSKQNSLSRTRFIQAEWMQVQVAPTINNPSNSSSFHQSYLIISEVSNHEIIFTKMYSVESTR